MDEPRWLTREVIEAVHADQIREHGGEFGLRDEGLLESALARPRQGYYYAADDSDICHLAAAYAFGLAKNHPFVDGNKRVAFVAMALFLELNGRSLEADEVDAAGVILDLAAGGLEDEAALARWIDQRCTDAS